MSGAINSILKIPEQVIGAASGILGGKKPEAPAPEVEPLKKDEKGPEDAAIKGRTADFETRAQQLGQRASAAGATRSDNDADLLGYVQPRRKSASRAILG